MSKKNVKQNHITRQQERSCPVLIRRKACFTRLLDMNELTGSTRRRSTNSANTCEGDVVDVASTDDPGGG